MGGKYDDIINLPHRVSKMRQPMSMLERAAQFSPFQALTGYGAAIKETARMTDEKAGGSYVSVTERVRRIDEIAGQIILVGGEKIPIHSVCDMQSEWFSQV